MLDRARELGGEATDRAIARLAGTYEGIAARGIADRVSLDLGLLRDLGYYTGAILEVYDPALGHILGGGGRYDERWGGSAGRCRRSVSPSTSSACILRRRKRSGWGA